MQARGVFEIEVSGRAREVYEVEASSAEEAIARFNNGEVTDPCITEVSDAEIVSVKEIAE